MMIFSGDERDSAKRGRGRRDCPLTSKVAWGPGSDRGGQMDRPIHRHGVSAPALPRPPGIMIYCPRRTRPGLHRLPA